MSHSSENRLDSRLRLCANFVRNGARLADIGTDHAYLAVWLCRIGICPSAIAADINPEPLSRGTATIAEAGLSGVIETRLSDGLKNIGRDEADDIVIAGMGGELIAKILSECEFSNDTEKHFILQPMTKSEVLIKWLYSNGFEIIEQDCCVAAEKCYTVLLVQFTNNFREIDEIFCYKAKLNPRNNETHKRFIQNHINRLHKKALGDIRCLEIANQLEAEM